MYDLSPQDGRTPFIRIPCPKHQPHRLSRLWHPVVRRLKSNSLSQPERDEYYRFWNTIKDLERDGRKEHEEWSSQTGEPKPINLCCPHIHLLTPKHI